MLIRVGCVPRTGRMDARAAPSDPVISGRVIRGFDAHRQTTSVA
jgi:hypothetical protein